MSGRANKTRIGQQFIAAGALLVAGAMPSIAGDLNPGLATELEYAEHLNELIVGKPAREVARKKFEQVVMNGAPATGETCVITYRDIKKGDEQIAIPQFFHKEAALLGAQSLPPMHPYVWPHVVCDRVRANELYNRAMRNTPRQ